MKTIKKFAVVVFMFVFIFLCGNEGIKAESTYIDVGGGTKVRIDYPGPNDNVNQIHGHEYSRNGQQIGSENLDGSIHDGSAPFSDRTKRILEGELKKKEKDKYKNQSKKWNDLKKQNEQTEGYKNKHSNDNNNNNNNNKGSDNKSKKSNATKAIETVAVVGAVVLVGAAILSPIPGDEALAAGLLLVP